MASNASLMEDIKPKAIANIREMLNEADATRLLTLVKETGSLIAGGFLLHALHDEKKHNQFIRPLRKIGNYAHRPDLDIYVPVEHALKFMEQLIYGSPAVEPLLKDYRTRTKSFKSTLYCQSFLRKNGIQTIHNIFIEDKNRDPNHEIANYEIDVMIVRSWRTPLQVVNNFDLSFCQVWFDGENVYASHPEDVRNKKGILQGEYVNLFLQGNLFLQNRLQKYRTRGYQVRLDPVRLEEIGDNILTTIPICGEETREAIMKHWTSRVILYWLVGVRDTIIRHEDPLPPSIPHDNILILPLLLHKRNTMRTIEGDAFIQARSNRLTYSNNYPIDIDGYDSEDYEDDKSFYSVLEHFSGEEWNETRGKVEFFRETNKLIETIMWPNTYKVRLPTGGIDYYPSMGFIFDYEGYDRRHELFMPFYNALRDRCIRKSKYTAITNPAPNNNDDNDDNDEDEEDVFDFHDHPLNAGISAADLEAYLSSSYMDAPDKNAIPCYHRPNPEEPDHPDNCQMPITLSHVKYIVSKEFYDKYTKPRPQKMGLNQFIDFFDQLLGNEKEVNSLGFGEIYHHTLCPFCLQFESRDSGCAYMTHDKVSGMPLEPYCKEALQIKELIDRYRASAQVLIDREYGGHGPPAHIEFCAECGRPCANHKHLTLDGRAFEAAPQRGGHDDYGKCAGGGRAELFARVLAIRKVYRENYRISSLEERTRAALAADRAPRDSELMAKAREILAMAPAERKWGNAPLPVKKRYTNEAYKNNVENGEENNNQNIGSRRMRMKEAFDEIVDMVERLDGALVGDNIDTFLSLRPLYQELRVIRQPGFEERMDLDDLEEKLRTLRRELLELERHLDENEEKQAEPENDAERRRKIRERYDRLFREINEMADDMGPELFQPIADGLQEIGEIEGPEFDEVHNLDHYEAELDRLEQMLGDLAGNNENEEPNAGLAARRQQMRERFDSLTVRIRYILDEDQHGQAVARLGEFAVIGQPEFNERMDLDDLEERLRVLERRVDDGLWREGFEEANADREADLMELPQAELLQQFRELDENQDDMRHLFFRVLREKGLNPYQLPNAQGNVPNNEIFNGGRFKKSRKKQVRRKQKTLRNLLKKIK